MMAATQSPAWVAATGASSVHSLDDRAGHCFVSPDTGSPPSLFAQEASMHADVPPNPPFVFPARLSTPSPGPMSRPRPNRRPASAIEPLRTSSPSPENGRPRRSVALPAFNFNPGASLAQDPDSLTSLSPPITPNSPSSRPFPSPSRPARHGHRRGGSEFIGGSIRDGNSIAVLSTSPTKSESGFASPGITPRSRGHRRVVSGTNCASHVPLLRPFPGYHMLRGNSAPNSPTSFEPNIDVHGLPRHQKCGLPAATQAPQDIGGANAEVLEAAKPHGLSSDVDSSSWRQMRTSRTRVGFSDKLEFIPRPLSMISSDTSSTATARPGHSVSGSISSVVSVTSPCDRESPVTLSKNLTRDMSDSRPSTAGAILERMAATSIRNDTSISPKRRNSNPTLLSVAAAQAADPNDAVASTTPKRWSFFGLETSFISPAVVTKPRSSSSSSSESVSKAISAPSSSDLDSDSTETVRHLHAASTDTHPCKKMSRKKRVKGWAGSILPLKPRGQKKQNKANGLRPPTPPASVDPLEDDDDDDETEEAEQSETLDAEAITGKDAESPVPERERGSPEARRPSKDDSSHAMIDLDAALGPFNTPLPHNAEWEAAQRATGTTGKRRMHSAQGMKGFSGPGMHYHRRSESAPELPPFDIGRSSMHCLNSNSAMADVFEEDEDEDEVTTTNGRRRKAEAATLAESQGDAAATPPAVRASVEAFPLRAACIEPVQAAIKRASSEPTASAVTSLALPAMECSSTLGQGKVIVEDAPSIIFCSADASGAVSATSSPKRLVGSRDVLPVELHQPASHSGTAPLAFSPYSTSLSSSNPSPRSPVSTDAQRMSTAPSSVTDKNSFQSLLMGEPGPEVRMSADFEVRSLASSNSTMTRDSSFVPSQRMSQPTLRDQRPVSVSSAAFGRRRSSLVSLSRLISSAHGERSKLSMEVTLDNESASKKTRSMGNKTKDRLSRMMQFWKPSKGGAPA